MAEAPASRPRTRVTFGAPPDEKPGTRARSRVSIAGPAASRNGRGGADAAALEARLSRAVTRQRTEYRALTAKHPGKTLQSVAALHRLRLDWLRNELQDLGVASDQLLDNMDLTSMGTRPIRNQRTTRASPAVPQTKAVLGTFVLSSRRWRISV